MRKGDILVPTGSILRIVSSKTLQGKSGPIKRYCLVVEEFPMVRIEMGHRAITGKTGPCND